MTTTESLGRAHRVETRIRDLAHRARTSPQQYRLFFLDRHRNALLRDLGQLHYDAHLDQTEADPDTRQRLLDTLDEIRADHHHAITDPAR